MMKNLNRTKQNFENTLFINYTLPMNLFFLDSNIIPHWHEHIEILYITKGDIEICVEDKIFTCKKGDIVIIGSNCLHSSQIRGVCEYYAIIVGKSLFDGNSSNPERNGMAYNYFSSEFTSPLIIHINHLLYTKIQQTIENIINECNNMNSYYQSMVKTLFSELFILLSRNYDFISSRNADTERFKVVFDYIENNYGKRITLSALAELVHLTPQHFSRVFKEYSGHTIMNMVNFYRINKAQELIENTNMTITLISELTGFCNINYFNRVFKKYKNVSPMKCRRR